MFSGGKGHLRRAKKEEESFAQNIEDVVGDGGKYNRGGEGWSIFFLLEKKEQKR